MKEKCDRLKDMFGNLISGAMFVFVCCSLLSARGLLGVGVGFDPVSLSEMLLQFYFSLSFRKNSISQ